MKNLAKKVFFFALEPFFEINPGILCRPSTALSSAYWQQIPVNSA